MCRFPAGGDVRLDISGDSLEMRTVLEWDDAEEIGLKVRSSPDGEEENAGALQYQPPEGVMSAPAG